MKSLILVTGLALAAGAVHAVDDGRGRDWRPITETQAAGRPSWEQVRALCPDDGTTACAGTLGGVSLKDWVWATRPQLTDLFSVWAPPILQNPDGVGGYEWQAAAGQFQALFGITAHLKGCPTYQPCWNIKYSTGMTASTVAGTTQAYGGEVWVDLEWGGGGFHFPTPLHPDLGRGLWMWRPTGLGTPSVHAYDDSDRLALPGAGTVIADVMANDWVGGQRAMPSNTTLMALSSPAAGLWLEADGSVRVAAGLAAGSYAFDYRLCNRTSPNACDDATVSVTVPSFAIAATADAGTVSFAPGGTAIANVLANDTLGSTTASPATVTLATVSTSHPGVALNPATGAVTVAAGTPSAVQTLSYRICERASPANCAQATATVSPIRIDAVNDSARGSSKRPNTPLASVLANDIFGSATATVGKVTITQVSITPRNGKIRIDPSDGSVDVLGRTASGLYQIVYRICETASPSNCDQATVSLDLSGGD